MSADTEMLQLLHEYYEQPDSPSKLGLPQGHVDIWKLEDTISKNDAAEWHWQGKTCSVCGYDEVVVWDQVNGYRCERHR
jgi:hypothetical protein